MLTRSIAGSVDRRRVGQLVGINEELAQPRQVAEPVVQEVAGSNPVPPTNR